MSATRDRRAVVRGGPRPAHDDGAITLFVSVMMVALFAAIGLVVDAGGRIHAIQQSRRAAGEAARAALSHLEAPPVMRGGSPRPDTAAAAQAARHYLTAADVDGEVAVVGETVRVTARVTYEPVFLSAIGFGPMTLRSDATASPARGVTQEVP